MTADDRERILRGAATKAEKVRRLHAAGCSRSEIAAALGLSYHHVRNAIVGTPAGWRPPADLAPSERPLPAAEPPSDYGGWTVRDDGSVVVPGWAVARLGGRPGLTLAFSVEEGAIRLLSRSNALDFVRAQVAAVAGHDAASWSDQLLAERRNEAGDG